VIVAAVLAGVAVLALVYREAGWLRFRVRRRVLVTLTDGAAVEGILRTVARDGLVLVAARVYGDESAGVTLSGDTFVPRSRIGLVQILPPPAR